jgi:hypothetical protein
MAPAGQTTYQKDERVLCFHHEILYEAKILDLRHTDPDDRKSPYEYLVHYKGWKNTYVLFINFPGRLPSLRAVLCIVMSGQGELSGSDAPDSFPRGSSHRSVGKGWRIKCRVTG